MVAFFSSISSNSYERNNNDNFFKNQLQIKKVALIAFFP